MAEINTVVIPLEEYMELREKANMNGFLMNELGRFEARFQNIDQRLYDLERKGWERSNGA